MLFGCRSEWSVQIERTIPNQMDVVSGSSRVGGAPEGGSARTGMLGGPHACRCSRRPGRPSAATRDPSAPPREWGRSISTGTGERAAPCIPRPTSFSDLSARGARCVAFSSSCSNGSGGRPVLARRGARRRLDLCRGRRIVASAGTWGWAGCSWFRRIYLRAICDALLVRILVLWLESMLSLWMISS